MDGHPGRRGPEKRKIRGQVLLTQKRGKVGAWVVVVLLLTGFWGEGRPTQAQELFGITSFNGGLGWRYELFNASGTGLNPYQQLFCTKELQVGLSGFFFTPSLAQLQFNADLSLLPGNVGTRSINTQLNLLSGRMVSFGLGMTDALVEIDKEGGEDYQRQQTGWSVSSFLNLPGVPVRLRFSQQDTETRGATSPSDQEKSHYTVAEGNFSLRWFPAVNLTMNFKGTDRQDEIDPVNRNQRYYEVVGSSQGRFFYDLIQNTAYWQGMRFEETGKDSAPSHKLTLSDNLSIRHSADTSSYLSYNLDAQQDPKFFLSEKPALGHQVRWRVSTRFLPELGANLTLGGNYYSSAIYTQREITGGGSLSYNKELHGFGFSSSYGLTGTTGERDGLYRVVLKEPYPVPTAPPYEVVLREKGIDLDSIVVWFKDDEADPPVPLTDVTSYVRKEAQPDGTVKLIILDTQKIPPGKYIYVDYRIREDYPGQWTFLSQEFGAQVEREVSPGLKVHGRYRHGVTNAYQKGKEGLLPGTESVVNETGVGASYHWQGWQANGEFSMFNQTLRAEATLSGRVGEVLTYGWATWSYDQEEQKETIYSGVDGRGISFNNLNVTLQGIGYQERVDKTLRERSLEVRNEISYRLLYNLTVRGGVKYRYTEADVLPTNKHLMAYRLATDWRLGATVLLLSFEQELSRWQDYDASHTSLVWCDYQETKAMISLSRSF